MLLSYQANTERKIMPVTGIVAEFNPLHSGHELLISYARKDLGSDSVVIAEGADFTQRGGIALLDRYSRAECAVCAGADLIAGIPAIASCSSAEIFASCGVSLLYACGCDTILCGYEGSSSPEESDAALIKLIASILTDEPSQYKKVLQKGLRTGLSFPKAREEAILSCLPGHDDIRGLLSSPNNILAIEYQKAITKLAPSLKLVLKKRKGQGYNDSINDGEFVSASYIRRQLSCGNLSAVKKHLSSFTYKAIENGLDENLLLSDRDLDLPLQLALLREKYKGLSFSRFLDVSDDLSNRIERLLPRYQSFNSFTDLLKNKSLTASRIRRALIHILLGITDHDLDLLKRCDFRPYLWILQASEKGRSMLSHIKKTQGIPLFMSVNELGSYKDMILKKDLEVRDIYRAIQISKSGILIPDENSRRITCGKAHDL